MSTESDQGTVTVVDAGPRRVSRRVSVGAPPEMVFALVSDPRRHGELDGSGTVGDVVNFSGALQVGSKFAVRMRQFGLPYKITSTVTRLEQNRAIEWSHPAGHRWRWELAEAGPGRTVVTETMDYSTSKAPKAIEFLKLPAKNASGIEATLRKLAARFP